MLSKLDRSIAVALGLASADHPLTDEVKARVRALVGRAQADQPFVNANLLHKAMVNVGPGEAQAALDALESEGSVIRIEGWGYVAKTQAEAAHVLLGRQR